MSEEHRLEISFYHTSKEETELLHIKLFQLKNSIPLSDVLPILENLRIVRYSEERPHQITLRDGSIIWISDYELVVVQQKEVNVDIVREIFQVGFRRV